MIPIPPLVWKVVGVLAALAVVAAGALYEYHHIQTVAVDAYKSTQAVAAGKQVATNQTAVAAITASEADGLRQIAASAQESRNEVQKRNDALVGTNAALSSTVEQLRTRLAHASQQPVVVSGTAAGGSVAHAAGDAPLPDGLADLVRFNSAQFLAADENAITITALQKIVTQDRMICNGALPGLQ